MVQLISAKYIGSFNIDLFFLICLSTYIHTYTCMTHPGVFVLEFRLRFPEFAITVFNITMTQCLREVKFWIFLITKKAEKLREKVILANERANGIQWRDIKKKNNHYIIRLYSKIKSTLLKPLFSTLSWCMVQTLLNPHNIIIWM